MDLPEIPNDGHRTQNTQQNEFLKEIYTSEERSRARLSSKCFQTSRNPILAEETPRPLKKEGLIKTDFQPGSSKFSFTRTVSSATENFSSSTNSTLKSNVDQQEHQLRSSVQVKEERVLSASRLSIHITHD